MHGLLHARLVGPQMAPLEIRYQARTGNRKIKASITRPTPGPAAIHYRVVWRVHVNTALRSTRLVPIIKLYWLHLAYQISNNNAAISRVV